MHFKFKFPSKEGLLSKGLVVLIAVIFISSFLHYEGPISNIWSPSYSSSSYQVVNSLPPIDPHLSSDTSHWMYEKLKSQAQYVRDLKNGNYRPGSNFTTRLFDSYTAVYCDTCSSPIHFQSNIGERQRYIKLSGWKLNTLGIEREPALPEDIKFFVKNGQSYLRKTKVVSIDTNHSKLKYKLKVYDAPVNFRYDRHSNSILIPISESKKSFVDILAYGMLIVIFGWMLYTLSLFLEFLIRVSKGLIFIKRNIWILSFLGWTLVGYPIVMVLLNLLIRLIFNSYFSDEVEINSDIWTNWRYQIIGGLVFLLLSRAFRRGKKLQEEAELTV